MRGSSDVRKLYAKHLTDLGAIARGLGRTQEALTCFQSALKITEEDNPADPALPPRLANVAFALYELGRVEEALPVYRQVIRMERQDDSRIAQLGRILSNLSMCYDRLERPRRAEALARLALKVIELADGQDPMDRALAESNLAVYQIKQRRYPEALPIALRVLEVETAHRDPEDPAVAAAYHNVGFCYDNMGDLHEAEKHYQQAIDWLVRAYGYEHENCLNFYCVLMPLYLRLGNLEAAKGAMDAALGILDRIAQRGGTHAEAGTVFRHACDVCQRHGDFASAADFLLKSIQQETKQFGPAWFYLSKLYVLLADLYAKAGKWGDEAEAWEHSIKVEEAQAQPRQSVLEERRRRLDQAKRKAAEPQ